MAVMTQTSGADKVSQHQHALQSHMDRDACHAIKTARRLGGQQVVAWDLGDGHVLGGVLHR